MALSLKDLIALSCLIICGVILVYTSRARYYHTEYSDRVFVAFKKTVQVPIVAENTETTEMDYIFKSEEITRSGNNKLSLTIFHLGKTTYVDHVMFFIKPNNITNTGNTNTKVNMDVVVVRKIFSSYSDEIYKGFISLILPFIFTIFILACCALIVFTCHLMGWEGGVSKTPIRITIIHRVNKFEKEPSTLKIKSFEV